MKNLLSVYNTFKCTNESKEKESLNDIIKGTKRVLANKCKFKEYIFNYTKTTEKYTFKTPGITQYPVFKKQSDLLIPVKTKRLKLYDDLNTEKIGKSNDDTPIRPKKLLFFSPKESLFRKKLIFNINKLAMSKKIFKNKLNCLYLIRGRSKKERYNSLFLDFFHKWNNEQSNMNFVETISSNYYTSRDYIDCSKKESHKNTMEFINNDNYSELKYDDNIIFNTDYSKFINERIEYIKHNKIENKQTKLESIFNDSNGKEIKLKLDSVKIIFKAINEKKQLFKSYNCYCKTSDKTQEETTKDIVLYVPLYYAFLLCYKDFQLFKHILVTSINFSDDYEKISFNEKTISSVLRTINSHHNNIKKDFSFDPKKRMGSPLSPKKNLPIRKTATKNYTNFSNNLFGEKFGSSINSVSSFNASKNIPDFLLNKNKKKEEIFHSNNRNRNRNQLHNSIHLFSESADRKDKDKQKNDGQNNINNINNNSNSYNEYIFLWETNNKTFIVTVQMPMIYFKYKTIKNEIIAFCDRNLFLYLYRNNFINWDFYVLNFLFSIKAFRKIILSNYSINKRIILNDIFTQPISTDKACHINNLLSFRNKPNKNKHNCNERNNDNLITASKTCDIIINEDIIINNNKNKIYNILNENNESYIFFYTDKLYNNSIIKLYSYLIVIDYDKLNPKLKWKYYLDFKQMKQLNEITKYESLDSFLPKIIKTDFQNGFLSMDFSLFNEFNIEILGYEKKNIIKLNRTKTKNKTIGNANTLNSAITTNDLCIDIQFPFIKVEKVINDNNEINESIDNNNSNNNVEITFSSNMFDLDITFLQKINNYKINSWSKRILELLIDKGEIANISPLLSKKK